jgi:hypothetical protein
MNSYYLAVPFVVIVFAVAAIILVALLRKGDVNAHCSFRSFTFTLHAKDRMTAPPKVLPWSTGRDD